MSTAAAFLESLRRMRRIDPSLANPVAETLLTAAVEPKLTMTRMSELCGTSLATNSRLIAHLGSQGALGKPGLGLILTITDPSNHRTKLIGLSDKGRAAVDAIVRGGPKGAPPAPEDPAPPPAPGR